MPLRDAAKQINTSNKQKRSRYRRLLLPQGAKRRPRTGPALSACPLHVGVGVGGGVGNKLGASERDDLGNKLGASASDGDELGASEEDELGDELGARMAMRLVHRKETNWAMSLAHWMAMNLA